MAYGYKRRSDGRKDRQEASINDQEKWIIETAKLNGEKITKWFFDDESAKEANMRPSFDDMLSYAEKNPDSLYTWKLNRLCRNSLEEGRVKHALEKGFFKKIVTVTGTFNPTDNILLASVELAMATQYSRDLSTDVARRMISKVSEGGYVFMAPLGYWNDKNTKSLKIDEEKAPYIQEMFRLRAEGMPEIKISKILFENGLRSNRGFKVARSMINSYLRNPVYMGMTRFRDEVVQGTHEPIVSKDLFYRVKAINDQNKKVHKVQHDFAFRGLFTCKKCGGAITAEKQKDITYYRCTKKKGKCDQKYIRGDRLEEIVLSYFSQYQLPEEVIEDLSEKGAVELSKINERIEKIISSYNQRVSKILVKLKTLKEMRLNEEMDSDEYKEDRTGFLKEMDQLEIDHKKKLKVCEMQAEDLLEWLELMKSFGAWAKKVSANGWRGVFNFVGSNYLLDDEKLIIERKNLVFEAIEKWNMMGGDPGRSALELLKTIIGDFPLIKEMLKLNKILNNPI